jgi:hypothetical protein
MVFLCVAAFQSNFALALLQTLCYSAVHKADPR